MGVPKGIFKGVPKGIFKGVPKGIAYQTSR